MLIEKYGVTKSFYYNALIITISSIPSLLLISDPSEVPLDQTTHQSAAKEETAQANVSSASNVLNREHPDRDGNTIEPSQPHPMKLHEFLTTKQFYVQFVAICFALLPGFAMKFNISVFASAIFQADTSTQAMISFIYLFSYSLIRLVAGLLAGSNPIFSSSHIASFSAGVQVRIETPSSLILHLNIYPMGIEVLVLNNYAVPHFLLFLCASFSLSFSLSYGCISHICI